ncbi:GNAT family N-acetyltransferase [Frankia sp. CNm7]|uniref:GNAT family N-acetyltransferase n=1 Tax=Frankia nepalensis TaxID=1836974 RepID=A0A937UQJ0_9ACTN|nr:bifunctional GNAT family N-acetyltransferase/acetate--CoA ligase family protein [Frankia nepalensis]MBL7499463.1 GNAT family N-acetyltransferase [Frankia nepalensis]MBL7513727.1 GNAT family N-acetyltransferase [Frankia nepalensis]MBL7522886.1 GNAT family N-acetyltransferase [Frankia nepalensis]MBL7628305.1 GNAT family N-acetyltransferase [Frankia nepalensis]
MWSACDVVLRDGAIAHLRPVRAGEGAQLRALHARMSDRSNYFRFFTSGRSAADRYVDHLVDTADPTHGALVAEVGGRLVGVAGYERLADPAQAEIAFAVEEAQHGRGVGSLLLEHLAAYARDRGVTTFVAQVHAQNTAMLGVFADAGFPVRRRRDAEVVDVTFPVTPTESLLAAQDSRESEADVRSLRALLRPRSVAVVGASRRPRTVGHEVVRNIVAGGFPGPVHVVNPHASEVAGVAASPTVGDLPGPVDLAVVAVPAAAAGEVVDDCARAGVRAIVVLTAGFAEAGARGRAREAELVARARSAGMRIVGPNCMGIVNTAAGVALNATFAVAPPRAGRIGVVSQSGGLGIALLEQASALGLGLSTFVSTGNKADVSGNDLLLWAEQDPGTDVVALYLESFGNPRKFSRIARRVSRAKPVVAVKGGGSGAGSRAARSHTAAAVTSRTHVDALFRQAGVIAVDGLGELLDTVSLLAHQPLPAGGRLAIVGNAGGPCVLAADAADAAGLTVAELTPVTQDDLRAILPPGAAVAGPVDTIASVSGPAFEKALRAVLADPGVDGLLAVVAPTPLTGPDDLPAAIRAAAGHTGKPVLAVLLGQVPRVTTLEPTDRAVCAYSVPEDAVRAFARAAGHATWLARRVGTVPNLTGLDRDRARAIVDDALTKAPDGCWLPAERAVDLVAAYGIPIVPVTRVAAADAAAAAAARLGGPVVLKAGNPDLVHKSDRGGVALGLATPAAAAAAYATMAELLGDEMGGGLVSPTAEAGIETLVGVVQDPAFGPLVAFGLGGVLTDLLADRAYRLLPLTDVDAAELVREPRGARQVLGGFRGAAAGDQAAVEEVLLRVARLADAIPEIREMDINPLIVTPSGAVAVDVKIRVAPAPDATDPTLRRLR